MSLSPRTIQTVRYKGETYTVTYKTDTGGYWEPDEEVLVSVDGNLITDHSDQEIVENGEVISEECEI
tara:strand:+ start:3905 stop:4105 length:201 start_codon:yes stop_codon:yes gene_type:complete